MIKKIYYDRISQVYNQRYQVSPLSGIQNYLENILENTSPQRILEVGSGTGHWLSVLSKFQSQLFGVDLSVGMLKQFDNSIKSFLICSSADNLPLRKSSFDFIYCVNAIHQFNNPFHFIHNASSLLKNGGSLSIIGLDPFDKKSEWYMYNYFPITQEIDSKRFPLFTDLQNEMLNAGLADVNFKNVDHVFSIKNGDEVLNDHFLDKKGSSQLALLSNEEYFLGLQRIKNDINKSKTNNLQITFTTKLFFYALTGKKKL